MKFKLNGPVDSEIFENVDGWIDARAIGILLAHPQAFWSDR